MSKEEEEDKPTFAEVFFSAIKKVDVEEALGGFLSTVKKVYDGRLKWVDSHNFSQPLHTNDSWERCFSYDVVAAGDLYPEFDETSDSHVVVDVKVEGREGRYPSYTFGYRIQFFSRPKKVNKPDELVGKVDDYDYSLFETTFIYREATGEDEKLLARPAEELITPERIEDHLVTIGKDIVRILGAITTVGLLASSQQKRYVYYFSDPVEEEEEEEEESLS